MAKTNEKFVVALELGSSRAKMGIAGFDPEDKQNTLTVYNMADLPTVDSVRYGRITNIREVTDAVTSLLYSIDKKYPIEGRDITGLFISIGGRTLKSIKVSSRIVLPERREITEELMDRLENEAIENLSTSDEIICVFPVRYEVDNIRNPRPLGSLGNRLYAEYVAIVCNPSNKNDLINVVYDRVKLDICGITVRPVAIANMVLTNNEINAGCMLVDFGAETTTVAIYKNYALLYLATIPMGSRLITRDLASTLALTDEDAEAVKLTKGDAMPATDNTYDDQQSREIIDAVIGARLSDIVANIAAQPEFAGLTPLQLSAGIILTGGGAQLKNFARLLEARAKMKVRMATLPSDVIITNPEMAAPENLDLIALLRDGADTMRRADDLECVKSESTKTPVSKKNENDITPKKEEETEIYAEPQETAFEIDEMKEVVIMEDNNNPFDEEDYKGYEESKTTYPWERMDEEPAEYPDPEEVEAELKRKRQREKKTKIAEEIKRRGKERDSHDTDDTTNDGDDKRIPEEDWFTRMRDKLVGIFEKSGRDEGASMD